MKNILLSTILLLFIFSCVSNIQDSKKNSKIELSGKLYLAAPEFDSINGQAVGACDCCADNFLFINDSQFIRMTYCIPNVTYSKGKYSIKDNKVYFMSDSLCIRKEANMEKEFDTVNKNLPDFFLKSLNGIPEQYSWTRFDYKDKMYFKTDIKGIPFAAEDINLQFNDLKNGIKKDTIWLRLNLD